MKKYIFYISIFVSLILSSCSKDYFDINQNPNTATEPAVTTNLLLPTALHNTGFMYGTTGAATARWMGMWTRGGDYGPNNEEESYDITTNFGTSTVQWANWYNFTFDYVVLEKKALATGQNIYAAIAKTMKTVAFMNLVDQFNNVPYSKAFDLDNNILPAYDKGPAIYKDLFAQLDAALVLLNTAVVGKDFDITNADIMYKGNIVYWKRFINTQRLKLILRLVNTGTTVINPTTEMAKITSDGYIGTSPLDAATVDPGYVKANNTAQISQQNPFWDTYKADVAGTAFDRFNRANNFALTLLKSTTNDIRYQYYYDKATTPLGGNLWAGMPYGYPSIAGLPSSANTSGVGGPGLAKSYSQGQWILTTIESKFLQAEAIARGLITGGGTPQIALDNAIRESFNWLGVTNAAVEANNYIASAPVAYTKVSGAVNGNSADIDVIIKQKYLSMIGISNFEPWTDYRRIGSAGLIAFYAPCFSVNASAAGKLIPHRFRYPQREYNFNTSNVAAEGDPNPQSSKIFWAK